jgi:hypothetical protein
MVTCPRCGGELERYELGGRAESSCSDCGYVGVPVDHASDRETPESWGTAIRRFKRKHADPDAPEEGSPPEGDADRETESGDDAPEDALADGDPGRSAPDSDPGEDGTSTAERRGGIPGDADERDATEGRADSRRTALLRRKKRRER